MSSRKRSLIHIKSTDDHQLVEEQIHEKKRKFWYCDAGELENLFQLLLNILPEGSERLATGDFGVLNTSSLNFYLCPVYGLWKCLSTATAGNGGYGKAVCRIGKDKELLKPVQLIKALLYDHISFIKD
ncbi:hypothetical protein CS542_09745 [Pedobacter sp. IW39]|nr:hypothetical protein CS542_09745 [Pedobacter sp. IW39]